MLTPRYYAEATKGDTVLFSSRWLRHAVVPYLLARASENKDFSLDSIVSSCGIPKDHLERWLLGWKSTNEVEETPSDPELLVSVEKRLWEWIQSVADVYRLCTYGLVEDESLKQMLAAENVEYFSNKSKCLMQALGILKRAELIKKQETQGKSEAKQVQSKGSTTEGGQKAMDKAKVHRLVKGSFWER